jgi:hypothetical protein
MFAHPCCVPAHELCALYLLCDLLCICSSLHKPVHCICSSLHKPAHETQVQLRKPCTVSTHALGKGCSSGPGQACS